MVVPITSELDLHTFQPGEVASLLPEYFRECRLRGLFTVRIVHGKGTGTLRERVHVLLRRMPEVAWFGLGNENTGGWGATVVRLHAKSATEGDQMEQNAEPDGPAAT